MAEEKKIETWVTIGGQKIPIYEGENKKSAVNRAIANLNEDTKNAQIAKAKAEADKLNGKAPTDSDIQKDFQSFMFSQKTLQNKSASQMIKEFESKKGYKISDRLRKLFTARYETKQSLESKGKPWKK